MWLVGQGTHFELWSEAGWQAQQQAMLALSAEDLAGTFEGVVL